MPNRILTSLPMGPETRCFRAFQSVLTTDPILVPVVKVWRFLENVGGSLEGDGSDLDFDAPPALPQFLPFVRCWWNGSENEWAATRKLQGIMNIGVTIRTPGTHQDDVTNLWAALRSAIRPADPTRYALVREIFREVGTDGAVYDNAGPGKPDPENAERNYLTATGTFRIAARFDF